MSSLADQMRDWHRGVQAVARGDWDCALRLFSGHSQLPARMCFNVGCVHLLAGDPEAALRAFDQAVAKDTCMAVGFLQRGAVNFQLERFPEAESDFQLALAQMRGNAAIDYTQLGLHFRLQAWDVLYNVASAQCQAGLWTQATNTLEEAISTWPEGAQHSLDAALQQVRNQVPLQLRQVPRGEVFQPPQRYLQYLEPMDFLGKAKVVAPAIPSDPHADARPQQVSAKPDLPGLANCCCQGERTLQLCILAGPGRCARIVLCSSDEKDGELVAGQSLLRALLGAEARAEGLGPARGAEARAEGLGPARAGWVPPFPGSSPGLLCQSPFNLWLPLQRPQVEQVGPQAPLSTGLLACGGPGPIPSEDPSGTGGAAANGPESLVAVTVQCRVTAALKVPRGASLASLRAVLADALHLQAQQGQLSYQTPGGELWIPVAGEEALQGVWRDVAATPRGLRLQCQGAAGRPVLYQVVAQHDYLAQGPEDLALHRGDTVDVLCEVDEAWLEGHHDGYIGIFPKCFVVPASACGDTLPVLDP